MLRMEIALFFVLAFVACIYFSAGRKNTPLHKTFSVFIFFCVWLLLCNWSRIDKKKKFAIGAALMIELLVSVLQAMHPTWLISGMGMTLRRLVFRFFRRSFI